MPDWSLLQQPNFAGALLSGLQAGQAIGRQRRLDTALGGVDLTRPETIMPVLQADPGTGTSLLSAASQMAQARQDAITRNATANGIFASLGMNADGTPAVSATPAMPPQSIQSHADAAGQGAASNALDPSQGDDIVITGRPQVPSQKQQALANWISSDPQGYIKTQTAIAGMTKAQREATDAAMNTFGSAVEAAKGMPYEQRRSFIQAQRGALIAHGVDPAQIDNFDPTDTNISGIENQVLGVKGIMERQDKDRTFQLDQDKFGETQRHNRADEGTAAANAATSRGQLGIAAGHLALDRQKESREAATSSGGAIGPRYEYRTGPNGQVQRRLVQ